MPWVGVATGFCENELLGRELRLGPRVVISLIDRDPRCKMITLDPDSAAPNPEVLRKVNESHEGMAGLYGAVLAKGTIHAGDPVEVFD